MTTSYIQANTDGRLHDATSPSVSVLNRGFLYGDAVYEVWRTYEQVVFAWDEHWERLLNSAAALHLELSYGAEAMWPEVVRTVAAFRAHTSFAGDVYIRLQISRGAGPIGLDPALSDRASFVILVQPVPVMSERMQQSGLHLSIAQDLRRNPRESLDPAWKTGNYLNNLLALREARSRGADDVVLLNLAGELTECSTSNLGFVQDGVVYTPPLTAGILAGVTRRLLLSSIAQSAGYEMQERTLKPAELDAMDEAFVMSSTKDIQPVGCIDEHRFPVRPDSVTARLKAAFQGYAAAHAAQYSERKV